MIKAKFKINRSNFNSELADLRDLMKLLKDFEVSDRTTAKILLMVRRKLAIKYKGIKTQKLLDKVYARNIEVYGNKLGPDIKWFEDHNKSYQHVIDICVRQGAMFDPLSDSYKP